MGKAPPALLSPRAALSPALALPAPGSKALRLRPAGQTEPWPLAARQNPTPGTGWSAGGPGGGARGEPGMSAAALLLLSKAARLASGAGGSARGLLLSSELGRPGGARGEEGRGQKEARAGGRKAEVLKPSASGKLCGQNREDRQTQGAGEIASHISNGPARAPQAPHSSAEGQPAHLPLRAELATQTCHHLPCVSRATAVEWALLTRCCQHKGLVPLAQRDTRWQVQVHSPGPTREGTAPPQPPQGTGCWHPRSTGLTGVGSGPSAG